MKKGKLYTANKYNQNVFGIGGYVVDTSNDGNWLTNPVIKDPLGRNSGVTSVVTTPIINNAPINKTAKDLGIPINNGGGSNFGNIAKGVAGAVAPMVGSFAGNAITGGFNKGTEVGSAISSVGSTIGGAVGAVNPLLGAAISVGSELLGGLTNRAFGHQENEETKAAVKAHNDAIETAGNAAVQASSNEDILNAAANASGAMGISNSGFGNGWFNHKGTDAYNNLVAAQEAAMNRLGQNLFRGAVSVDKMNDENIMRNFAALGGDLQSHGADFFSGLSRIDAGGSHEENPYDGVQVGISQENGKPNLVEEGETIFDDYVYSKRIMIDNETKRKFHVGKKTEISYADLSKKLEKEAAERPNDAISQRGLEKQMHDLADEQERQKEEMRGVSEGEPLSTTPAGNEEMMAMEPTANAVGTVAEEEMPMGEGVISEGGIGEMPVENGEMIGALGGKVNRFEKGGSKVVKKADGSTNFDESMFELPEVVVTPGRSVEEKRQALNDLATVQYLTDAVNRKKLTEEQLEFMEDYNNKKHMSGIHYYAEGGNLYPTGGSMKERIYKALGYYLDSDFNKWAKENNVGEVDWEKALKNQQLIDALKKSNPALAHSIGLGNDFGAYQPSTAADMSFDYVHGGWGNEDYDAWDGSNDAAWKEAVEKGLVKKGMKSEEIGKALSQTDAYKRGTEWLKASDANRLRYLQSIYNSKDAPEAAKKYAGKFVDANGWLKDAAKDYKTIFEDPNGTGVRNTHPGTYWKTPNEMLRGTKSGNYFIHDDGSVEAITGDVPTDLISAGSWSWKDAENDNVANYFKKKSAATPTEEAAQIVADVQSEKDKQWVANHRPTWGRAAGLLGPVAGLGLMAAGVGKPENSLIDAAVSQGSQAPYLAAWRPTGNYMKYEPFDEWSQVNRNDANARATDRMIMNNSGTLGTKMAGWVANNLNNQTTDADVRRKSKEYNNGLLVQALGINDGTDARNAAAFNQNSATNAGIINAANQQRNSLVMNGTLQKIANNAGWYNSLYGNVNNMFKGLGQWGKENEQYNMIAAMAADGLFGNLGDSNVGRMYGRRV